MEGVLKHGRGWRKEFGGPHRTTAKPVNYKHGYTKLSNKYLADGIELLNYHLSPRGWKTNEFLVYQDLF